MGILDGAAGRLSVPAEAVGACRVIISGDNSVRVENHRGLLEYTPTALTASRRNGIVRVRGEGLEIGAMDSECLIIRGRISAVDME